MISPISRVALLVLIATTVGANWVDSAAAESKNQNVRRIRFASADYFAFMA